MRREYNTVSILQASASTPILSEKAAAYDNPCRRFATSLFYHTMWAGARIAAGADAH